MRDASHDLAGFHAGKYGTVIVRLVSGSHLYGTATASSDQDIRGVFLPHYDALLAGDFPKVICGAPRGRKNTPDDSDETFISIHYFLKLALDGETNAVDWLHAAPNQCEEFSEDWLDLLSKRRMFYCKSMRGLVGYARKQAAKYGIRGSRIEAAQRALEVIESAGNDTLLKHWESLPSGEHLHKGMGENNIPEYVVCGKRLQASARASLYVPALRSFLSEYGHRAILAKENKGIDWKALSHAFRAAFQFKRLMTEHGYSYPLPESPFLLDVKLGNLDYESVVAPELESLMAEIEVIAERSDLPEEPDRAGVREWLVKACGRVRPRRMK